MRIGILQSDALPYCIDKNIKSLSERFNEAKSADLIITQQYCISGSYSTGMDFDKNFIKEVDSSFNKLSTVCESSGLLITTDQQAILITKGNIIIKPLNEFCIFEYKNTKIAVLKYAYCNESYLDAHQGDLEDIDLLVVPCLKHFCGTDNIELEYMRAAAVKIGKPLCFVNAIGGQDGYVFYGGSMLISSVGDFLIEPMLWVEGVRVADLNKKGESYIEYINKPELTYSFSQTANTKSSELPNIYQALLIGLRSYITKNNFKKVVIGLSGGADSAFVAILAADAIGAKNVMCVAMPSEFSSDSSLSDATELTKIANIELNIINIDHIRFSFEESLKEMFQGYANDITEENIQARIRGTILMSISNKFGALLLATSNKSEAASGYFTMYGDVCGGYAPISDVYKTDLYKLIEWRNNNIPKSSMLPIKNVIPKSIIEKAPSAELAHGQKDQDFLPEYAILDKILFEMIENGKDCSEIIKITQFPPETIKMIYSFLIKSEFKRKQTPICTKISKKTLKELNYPISNRFSIYEVIDQL